MKLRIKHPQFIFELGKRQNQEDSMYPLAGQATFKDRLFMVCDGMGGHEHGEVASQTVVKAVAQWMESESCSEDKDMSVQQAINKALDQLDALDGDSSQKRMGTTLALLLFHAGGALMAHVGDSRVYHIRPSERQVLYKSRDHSLVYELFMMEEISYEEMQTSPKKSVITRALMPGLDDRPTADMAHTTDIKPGDYFYICSDGMLEQMSDEQLVDILASEREDEEKKELLRAYTTENQDNHTAYLIRVEDVVSEENDDSAPNDEQQVKFNALYWEHKRMDETLLVPEEKLDESDESTGSSCTQTNNQYRVCLLFILFFLFCVLMVLFLRWC